MAEKLTARFKGNYMAPFLQNGDRLEMEVQSTGNARRGDLILIQRDNKFPICRVVDRDRQQLLLSFDNHRSEIIRWGFDRPINLVRARTRGKGRITRRHWQWKLAAIRSVAHWHFDQRWLPGLRRLKGLLLSANKKFFKLIEFRQ